MKPLILVTNDDGITSKGISVLIDVVKTLGDVFVVAPDSPNSGMGHAISVDTTIHIKKSKIFKDIEAYECSGTPADCVKLAKHHFLRGRKIDLVVSGINHGMNASVSVLYSGTMSAAVEAAIEGIPAIGFSLDDFKYDADFRHVKRHLKRIVEKSLKNGIPPHTALNVNFPAKSDKPIQGIKICRQTNGYWREEFDARQDLHGRPYFWMGGDFVNREPESQDTDIWAMNNNYTAIVPVQIDRTAYPEIKTLKKWKL
ncbi:5'/3'-nucleotidase SurE [Emticicia soli]|uniref:5'-nucleotidase SurE n=1 Tax=Emticicia soli TaxID=2027878 RepID=A0ABW5J5F2_9BACT